MDSMIIITIIRNHTSKKTDSEFPKATIEQKKKDYYFLFITNILLHFNLQSVLRYKSQIDFMDNIQQSNKTKRMDLKFLRNLEKISIAPVIVCNK